MGLMYALLFLVLVTGDQLGSEASTAVARKAVGDFLQGRSPCTVRPDGAAGPESPVMLHIGYSPLRFLDFDEASGSMKTTGYLTLSWTDSRLSYADLNSNTSDVRVCPDSIWTPDIELYESDSPAELLTHKPLAIVYPNGNVFFIPNVAFNIFCEPVSANGTIQCSFVMGSWTYSGLNLDMTVQEQVDVENLKPGPWVLHSASARKESKVYPCCPDPYPNIQYTFTLSPRQSLRGRR